MSHPNEFDPLAEGMFADIAALIAAGLEPERPTVAPVLPNGGCLLYGGRLNEIHGEPCVGKTNVALALCLPLLREGRGILYVDPEDTARSAVRRLLAFGAEPAQVVAHFHHTQCPEVQDYPRLIAWATSARPALVVIDGCAEILASLGLDENDPGDFLSFCRDRLQPFTELGCAVLLADHVVKSAEGRGRWARGTGAKMGKYDGVSYSVELGKSYSPSLPGHVRLRIAKDRNGGIGVIGQAIAEIHFTPDELQETTEVKFRRPLAKNDGHEPFTPTSIMERISRRLEEYPDSSQRDLRALGKSQYVDLALELLQKDGHLSINPGSGRRSTHYTLLQPYRSHAEPS